MTREELLEKRRKGFDEWHRSEQEKLWELHCAYIGIVGIPMPDAFASAAVARDYAIWNAALDSVEIELPAQDNNQYSNHELEDERVTRNDTIEACKFSIQSQGFKVKA